MKAGSERCTSRDNESTTKVNLPFKYEPDSDIKDKTKPENTIFVWDYIPSVYLFAGRRAPTRHFMYFNVATDLPPGTGRWYDWANSEVQKNRQELMSDLQANPPQYIVQIRKKTKEDTDWLYPQWHAPMFDPLQEFLDTSYQVDKDCSDYYILSWSRKRQ